MGDHSANDLAWRQGFFDMLWPTGELPNSAPQAWKIYRNTTHLACLEALRANYPTLAVLMGDGSFDSLARAYLAQCPPEDARLLEYGRGMASFMAGLDASLMQAHWVDVAELDRAWVESHTAADALVLSAEHVLAKDGVGTQAVCPPHPATRWRWREGRPLAEVWLNARVGMKPDGEVAVGGLERGQGVLLTRINDTVQGCSVGVAEVAFLEACRARLTLEQALGAAHAVNPDADLGQLVALMLERQALTLE